MFLCPSLMNRCQGSCTRIPGTSAFCQVLLRLVCVCARVVVVVFVVVGGGGRLSMTCFFASVVTLFFLLLSPLLCFWRSQASAPMNPQQSPSACVLQVPRQPGHGHKRREVNCCPVVLQTRHLGVDHFSPWRWNINMFHGVIP